MLTCYKNEEFNIKNINSNNFKKKKNAFKNAFYSIEKNTENINLLAKLKNLASLNAIGS